MKTRDKLLPRERIGEYEEKKNKNNKKFLNVKLERSCALLNCDSNIS